MNLQGFCLLTALGGSLLGILLLATSCATDSTVQQPIAFSHREHMVAKLRCTFCHQGAEKNRAAVIPSVALCMTCHSAVKADSSEILKVKAYLDRKEEIPWRRIYTLPPEADVFFNHRRHAAAAVPCSTCHGDVAARDVLRQEVSHSMGWCIDCHLENRSKFRDPRLAADCATCHG